MATCTFEQCTVSAPRVGRVESELNLSMQSVSLILIYKFLNNIKEKHFITSQFQYETVTFEMEEFAAKNNMFSKTFLSWLSF